MLSILLASGVRSGSAYADEEKTVVSVSDDGLHISVDFSAMKSTDKVLGEIQAEDVGAIDIDVNYQILDNGGDGLVLCTVNGFDPAWIIYEINAPAGQTLDTLVLTIKGRICDFSPVANAFAVFAVADGFTGTGSSCELNRIPGNERTPDDWEDYAYYVMQANHGTMATSGSIDDVHVFDLSEAAKGNSTMYVGIYQFTTNCPEWIEYRSLSIDATAVEKQAGATEAPEKTSEPETTEEPKTTEEPEATEEPETTEGPAATDVPKATDAPAATDNTAATEEPGKADNTGKSPVVPIVIGVCAAAVIAAAAVIIIRKKKK